MNTKQIILSVLIFCCGITHAQQIIPLYATIPGAITSDEVRERIDTSNGRTRVSSVTLPTLTAFFPEKGKANGTAVIICPGGGYSYLVVNKEGTEVAEAFVKKGVTAFVLKYRLPNNKIMQDKTIGPLQDAQQAIKLVREHAQEWDIDTARVGIMGFSAGGHLASTASTHFTDITIPNKQNTNLRPSFSILVYPVISFTDSLAHKGSRRNLLKDTLSVALQERFSNEKQVTPATPPTFIVHCGDDKVVLIGNSIKYYEALVRNGVKAEMHIYPVGGHGFALKNTKVMDPWIERCFNWMVMNKFIN